MRAFLLSLLAGLFAVVASVPAEAQPVPRWMTLPPTPSLPALPAGDPTTTTLQDYAVRAVWDDGRTLTGRTISLVGFVTPGSDGSWYLTRMTLTCCAADAVTTKILMVDAPSAPPADTWLTVVGTWVPGGGTKSPTAIPWLKVSSMKKIAQPKDPYE